MFGHKKTKTQSSSEVCVFVSMYYVEHSNSNQKVSPFLGNRIAMKACQVISSVISAKIQILQYLWAKCAIASHIKSSKKRLHVCGNACCVLAWLNIAQWDYSDKIVCQKNHNNYKWSRDVSSIQASSDKSWIIMFLIIRRCNENEANDATSGLGIVQSSDHLVIFQGHHGFSVVTQRLLE